MTTALPDDDDQGGFVVAEWVVGVAILIVPVILLMGVLPTWSAQHEAAAAAAREAARVVALFPDSPDVIALARTAATEVLVARNIDPATAGVTLMVPDRAQRDGVMSATVTIQGPAITLPVFGEVRAPAVGASHQRRLNPYRSVE